MNFELIDWLFTCWRIEVKFYFEYLNLMKFKLFSLLFLWRRE